MPGTQFRTATPTMMTIIMATAPVRNTTVTNATIIAAPKTKTVSDGVTKRAQTGRMSTVRSTTKPAATGGPKTLTGTAGDSTRATTPTRMLIGKFMNQEM